MLISVVLPMYNEQNVIGLTVKRVRPILEEMSANYEVLFVDDGSTDKTKEVVSSVLHDWKEARLIFLRSNRGHMAAITAGLEFSKGDFVVTIDADLQDPPELIPDMLKIALSEDLDVVYGVRIKRPTDTLFKRLTAKTYYSLIKKLLGQNISEGAADFRFMSRSVVDELLQLPEGNRVYRLLVPWLGYKSGAVEYERESRKAGKSHYSISAMTRLAIDSVASFTAAPLRIATWLGVVGMVSALIITIVSVIAHLTGNTSAGWTSLLIAIVFFGAIQLLCIGLIGEYVARIFTETQRRPMYYAQEVFVNLHKSEDGSIS